MDIDYLTANLISLICPVLASSNLKPFKLFKLFKRRTRNTELGTRNAKRRTRNAKHGTQNTEHKTRNAEHKTRNAKRETRNAKTFKPYLRKIVKSKVVSENNIEIADIPNDSAAPK